MTGATRIDIARGAVMLGTVSLIKMKCGAAVVYTAERLRPRAETIETCAGFLLIGGLGLIGSALPIVL
jgi:hypothetical protein